MIRYIRNLHAGYFGSVIGLSVLAMAWRIAHSLLDFPIVISDGIGFLAMADFVLVSLAFIIKIFIDRGNVKSGFNQIASGSLFSAIPISCMFIAGVLLIYAPVAASYIWHVGAICMAFFMILIIHSWMRHGKGHEPASVTWLLPVTGFASIPFIGLSFPVHGIWLFSQLCFAGGLLLTITLFVILMSGFFLSTNDTGSKNGSMLILSAPFVMSFLSYIRIKETIDQFADLLFYSGLFLLLVFIPGIFLSWKTILHRNAWCNICFPLSLLAIAALKYVANVGAGLLLSTDIAVVLLGMSSLSAATIFCLFILKMIHGQHAE